MSSVASALKSEISRLARKELRAETEALKKSSSHYRSEIAALKRRLVDLERQVARIQKDGAKASSAPATDDEGTLVRFSAKGLSAHRARLGFSAQQFGRLLGVSGQTIHNWESATTRPRPVQVAAIAEVRKLGKREALERISQGSE